MMPARNLSDDTTLKIFANCLNVLQNHQKPIDAENNAPKATFIQFIIHQNHPSTQPFYTCAGPDVLLITELSTKNGQEPTQNGLQECQERIVIATFCAQWAHWQQLQRLLQQGPPQMKSIGLPVIHGLP